MDADVYTQVKASIKQSLKIDLENYKDEQMKRRLDSWLVRSRTGTWHEYFELVSKDSVELERFRNYLTINVTEFFRDPARWNTLRTEILPYLQKDGELDHQPGGLKLWSAGCSIGAEPYSVAIMMAESAPRQQYSLLATDLDRGALSRAKSRGPYSLEDVHNLDPAQRQRHLTPCAPYFINQSLQSHIRFQEQDLLADRFETGFDLIICRNVVIYFTADAKDTLYAKFCAALRPGGVLFLGGTEIISGAAKYGLQNFGISFYKRI
jgi:chemotaxis protein methyltransferase CheR